MFDWTKIKGSLPLFSVDVVKPRVHPSSRGASLLTCEAGSHLLGRLEELGSLQGAVCVHILPPLEVLSHGVLDLLRANPLHGLTTSRKQN